MHHFLSSPNYLSHFSCSHQQVGTLFLVIHLGSIMRYENEKNETHKSPILCSPCLHYIFVLLFLRENGGRRLKVSQYILHTCLASKNIFVQEGKNRTLMQSGNHVAVRNVIIQFFGRPLLYVFKLVTKKVNSKNAKNSAKWLPKPLL